MQAMSLFIVGNGDRLDILVDRTRKLEEEILSWFQRIQIGTISAIKQRQNR